MYTKDQIVDRMMHANVDDLRESCYFAHKDQYGIKGHHLLKYTVAQLVSWWISHYEWDEKGQLWTTITPFDNEDYANRVQEADYYAQFG
jgi:hypothetical protein